MGNNAPIFSRVGNMQGVTLTAANITKDGTGTVGYFFVPDATNGSFLRKITVKPRGVNAAGLIRIWWTPNADNSVPAQNFLVTEIFVVASVVSETTPQNEYVYPINEPIPPGGRFFATLSVAGTGGWSVIGWGGDY
jgi:hypothetical protein